MGRCAAWQTICSTPVRFGDPAESRQRLQRGRRRLIGQRPPVEAAGAEPDDRLLAIDHLERKIPAYPAPPCLRGLCGWTRGSYSTSMSAELVIRQRVSALAKALPDAAHGHPVAVHQARVATRRLREALALTRGRASRKVEDAVRRLTRALGPVRELDVTLDLLAAMVADDRVSPTAATCVREAVREERRHLIATLRRRLELCNLDKLQRKAITASHHVVSGSDGDPTRITVARHRAARRARALSETMEQAAAIYLPDRLHEVRIAIKKLRYALEIVRELSRSRARVTLTRLKAAQALLGRMHDLEMLIARTRAVQASPRGPDLHVSAELDRFVRYLETECRRLHGHYIAMRKELLRICDRVVAAAETTRERRRRRLAAA